MSLKSLRNLGFFDQFTFWVMRQFVVENKLMLKFMDPKYTYQDLVKPENIERWAHTTELDSIFDQAAEEDDSGEFYDWFLPRSCSEELILKLAMDVNCLKRTYFIRLLIDHLFWIVRYDVDIPFYTSRFQGIKPEQEYMDAQNKRASDTYRIGKIVDQLRSSDDPIMRTIFNKIMDHRNTRSDLLEKAYRDASSEIHQYVNSVTQEEG